MKYQKQGGVKKGGFSLVELLVTIAVLGIIAAIAIANMTGINSTARVTAAQRKAQQIASVFAAGEGVGAPGFKSATTVETVMNAVGVGSAGAGANGTLFFQVPGTTATMDDDKPLKEQAKHYLSYSNGNMIFEKDGVPEAPAAGPQWVKVSGTTTSMSQAENWVVHFQTYSPPNTPTRIAGPPDALYVEQYF